MLLILLLVGVQPGCGRGRPAPAVDEGLAHKSLAMVLDAWKEGKPAESLQQGSPEIIAGDQNWKAGARLVNYKVLEPAFSDGSNLHIPVELELEDGAGVRSKQTVNYTIGTSPKITVFSEEG